MHSKSIPVARWPRLQGGLTTGEKSAITRAVRSGTHEFKFLRECRGCCLHHERPHRKPRSHPRQSCVGQDAEAHPCSAAEEHPEKRDAAEAYAQVRRPADLLP